MDDIDKAVVLLPHNYENLLTIGNFNTPEADSTVNELCDICSFKHLVKELRCNKNAVNPKGTDFMLTNHESSFQNSCVIKTGRSDLRKMTLTVLKSYFQKAEPKIISYRDFKKFSNSTFTWDPKWAQTGLRCQFGVNFTSV